jgi:hypothetical protein
MKKTIPLLAAALLASTPAFAAKYFLYVGSYTAGTSKGIYAWTFDSASGKTDSLGLVAETPQAAHSVAVAKPSTSEKNTARISSRQGMSLADSRSFSRNGIGGSRGGTLCGLSSDQPMM